MRTDQWTTYGHPSTERVTWSVSPALGCAYASVMPTVTPSSLPTLSTVLFAQIHPLINAFYPLSTPPTINTTKEI